MRACAYHMLKLETHKEIEVFVVKLNSEKIVQDLKIGHLKFDFATECNDIENVIEHANITLCYSYKMDWFHYY